MNTTKVKLRQKSITNGRKSLYLDFYPAIVNTKTGKETRREFLGLYVLDKAKGALDKQHNKETLALGENIRAKRQLEIQRNEFGVDWDKYADMDFIAFFEDLMKTKWESDGNYGNWKAAKKHLEAYTPNGLAMKQIDVDFLEGFKDFLKSNKKLKQNSKVSYYRKVTASIKKAHHKGYIKSNPVKLVEGLKEEETKREFLTIAELKKLSKKKCDFPILKKAFLFACLTGLRFSDIEKLEIGDIQKMKKKQYFIRYKQQKTGSEETLPISNSAIELIDLTGPNEQLVFEGVEYSAYHNKKFKDWINAAKINKKITFHCSRHTYATLQLSMGTDIYTLQKLLGHKELKTTEIYAHIIDQKKQEASNKLNEIKL